MTSYCTATQTLTFLFTDIEGSTQMLARQGERYRQMLGDHRRIVRESLAVHGGREVDTAGDGFFCVFSSPRECLEAATEMQQHLVSHPWPKGDELRVRMGVHTGEASVDADAVVGLDVHKAARIMAAAHGGQVLVSATTAEAAREGLLDGVVLHSMGLHRLKDLAGPEELYQLEAPGLKKDFPAIRSLDNPLLRHNLPLQATSFVGRVKELADVAALVSTARLVTLAGSGGCGKTRLALQVGADLLDGSAGGVWFSDLSPLSDPDLVASTVGSVLGMREDPTRPLLDQVVEHLSDRRLLLVLDNCEQVIEAAARLADAVLHNCEGVHVLATSREPLGVDGEHVYRVPSLSIGSSSESFLSSDAVQLFVQRARSHRPGFLLDDSTAPAVASICRHLDGVPLAIELAAARLRVLSPAEIESRLVDRFNLLTGGSRSALPRHQTLRAAIDWSYESLHERDRDVFDRLSVFAGGFSLDAADAVCTFEGIEHYEVLDAVASLVDKSLVQANTLDDATRYHLLETIRQYADERLAGDPAGEASAKDAHARYFLQLAETARPHLLGPDQNLWEGRLAVDLDNLRAAGAWLLASGTTEEALRFGLALDRFWRHSGLPSEELEHLERALSRPGADEHPVLTVRACSYAAYVSSAINLSIAERHIKRGLSLAGACSDDAAMANLLRNAAWVSYSQGRVDISLSFAEEALNVARRSSDENQIALAFHDRGIYRSASWDPAGARADLTEAAQRCAHLGDLVAVANNLNSLGALELEQGNLDAARRHLEDGLASSPSPTTRAGLEQNLAQVAILQGDVGGAAALTAGSLDLCHEFGDVSLYAGGVLEAALCLTRIGQPERAAELHGAADALRENSGAVWQSTEATLRADDHARLRAILGDDAFGAAYDAGQRLDADQTLTLALRLLADITGQREA